MQTSDAISPPLVLRVGEVIVCEDASSLTEAQRRQRVGVELLRQAAIEAGLLASNDALPHDGVISEAAADAIDRYVDAQVHVPDPDEANCRRYYAAHAARYAVGERMHVRHILFAVTPGVDVQALRLRAERALLDVRANPQSFGAAARELSNCPSGAQGGDLGWLQEQDCAPEFARELFAQDEGKAHVGVLPRLVHSRFGLHVVEVLARQPGQAQSYEAVSEAVAQSLRQQAWATAVRQTMRMLAACREVEGVDLDAADSPLLQ